VPGQESTDGPTAHPGPVFVSPPPYLSSVDASGPPEPFTLTQMVGPTARPPKRRMSTLAVVAMTVAVMVVLGGIAVVAVAVVPGLARSVGAPGRSAAPPPITYAPIFPTVTQAPAPAQPTDPVTIALGETMVFTQTTTGGTIVTEVNYRVVVDRTYTKSPKYGMRPEKGLFFGIRVDINVKTGSTYACPCDFALIAADGTAYASGGGFGFPGALEAVDLRTGQKAGGLVIFDVPAAASMGGKIELRENTFGDSNQGFWKL
jgi:hypothetical protein